MAIYNSKGKKWETSAIANWESLKLPYQRFFSNDISTFKVKYLELSNVVIADIERLKELVQFELFELDLNHNNINVLPNFFAQFTTLKILNLSYNNLECLSPEMFKNMHGLTTLNVSNNKLKLFPYEVIESLPRLVAFNLSSNLILDLHYHRFDSFSSSLTIYLDGCLFPLKLVQEIMKYLNSSGYKGPKIFLSVHDTVDNNNNNNYTIDMDTAWSRLTSSLKESIGTAEMDEIERERTRAIETYNCCVLENARREEVRVPRIIRPEQPPPSRSISEDQLSEPHERRGELDDLEQYQRAKEEYLKTQRSELENAVHDLKHVDKQRIKTWLVRIYGIFEAKNNKKLFESLCIELANCLRQADSDQELCNILYSITDEATQTCGDRVALSLLYLDMQYSLYKCKNNLNDWKTVYDLLMNGTWTIDTLQNFARYKVTTLNAVDELEVYLGYLIKLKDVLSIPVIISNMQYPSLSNLSKSDLEVAKKYVLDHRNDPRIYTSFLIEQELWIDVLKHHYSAEVAELTALRDKADDYFQAFEAYKTSLIHLTKQLIKTTDKVIIVIDPCPHDG
jgi:hypothetical protein